jgi:hypothetical protein
MTHPTYNLRGIVDQTTSDSTDQKSVIDLELNSSVQLLVLGCQHGVQLFGLDDGTGETVQDETALALGVGFQVLLDEVDHDFVRNQSTSVHHLLGLLANLYLYATKNPKAMVKEGLNTNNF